MIVKWDQRRESDGGWKLQTETSLEHISDTTLDLAVFDIKGSEVMTTWQRADERSKNITQTHGGKNDEMRCPQPDMNANECYVQERHIVDTTKN